MNLNKFKATFPDLANIDDFVIQTYLDMARDWIAGDGISIDDKNYDNLQRCWTAHLMHIDGYLKGIVVNERVGDVGIGYHDQQTDGYNDQWERLYYRMRLAVQGASSMISDTHNLPLY